ncbi:hypothetical protein VCHC55A1_2739 [Vibrio cholerae HC-55A1]|nr:hypothetical protein VCHC55A1_2739 [Vibrio cholerae HC-55A1]
MVNWQKGIHCQLIIFISLNMKSIHFLLEAATASHLGMGG